MKKMTKKRDKFKSSINTLIDNAIDTFGSVVFYALLAIVVIGIFYTLFSMIYTTVDLFF